MLLLYRDCDLMDENISVMNKYPEVYSAAVSSFVAKAQPTMVTSVPRITYFAIRYHVPSHYRCYIC
jgi:hypothetical protein